MGLSVRLFGLSSWSVLVPQALLGVASVGVLYATVRRWSGPLRAWSAGAVMALTPVAVLMFRFNNPDALLVLLLVVRGVGDGPGDRARRPALDRARRRVRGVRVPGQDDAGVPGPARRSWRCTPLAAPVDVCDAGSATCSPRSRPWSLAGGWWVAVVELWPAGSRPYIGGSQTNSVVELILGYNGFGRLTGNETGSVVPGGGQGPGGGSMWGETGWGRLFSASYGGQVAWLLPAALAMIAVLLWVSRRSPRTDLTRAATLGWGGWLLVTAAVISFSQGIIHEYYTVALAPAIGALVGIGGVALWSARTHLWARLAGAAIVAGSAWWSTVLLGRSASFVPWLAPAVLVGGLAVAVAIVAAPSLTRGSGFADGAGSVGSAGSVAGSAGARVGARVALAAAVGGLVVMLAGPAAYSVETASTVATGSIPSAGPAVAGARGGPGGGPGGFAGGPGRGTTQGGAGGLTGPGGPGGQLPGGQLPGGQLPGAPGGTTGTLPNLPGASGGTTGTLPTLPGAGGAIGPGAMGGGAGSLLGSSTPSQAITDALLADADQYAWVAATVGANSAAGYQLATEQPVMAIGGFNGSDPAPTLAQFQSLVADGQVHWFLGGGGFGGQMGGSQAGSDISTWVAATFEATTVDGVTMYDLTAPTSTSSPTAGVTSTV